MDAASQISRRQAQHASVASGPAPRLFVDLTTSMMRAEDRPIAATRFEAEVARRLLARPALNPLPVAFDEHGAMFALDEEAAEAILALAAGGAATRWRERTDDQPADLATPATAAPAAARRPGALRFAASAARAVARNGVRMLPDAVREDTRAILIHGRQIVRTMLYGRPRPPAPAAARSLPAPPIPVRPLLRAVVHPRAGDVLWTGAPPDGFAPLRLVAEMERYRAMKVVAVFHGQARLAAAGGDPQHGAAVLQDAAAIDLLRAASRVVAVSGTGRADLLAFAAAAGLSPPPVVVIRPGSTLASVAPGAVPAGIAPRRFALAFGAVGVQQNQALLVRVWEALAADPDFALDLVIVGAVAPGGGETASRIEASPLFGTRIAWIEHCPDDVLAALFRAADAVLDPDFADGGVFAITEALAFGRPLLASERGAVGALPPGATALLDPRDDRAWAEALRGIGRGARPPGTATAAPDWDDCADAVAHEVAALMSMTVEH